jgi:hypothetical protein
MCLSVNFVVSDIIPLSLPIPSEIRTCSLDGDSVEGRIFRNVFVVATYYVDAIFFLQNRVIILNHDLSYSY